MPFRSIRAALDWYYHQQETGGVRAIWLPKEGVRVEQSMTNIEVEAMIMRGRIAQALDCLGDTQRRLIKAYYWQGRQRFSRWEADVLGRAEKRLVREMSARGVLRADKIK